jgi:hypothetical protein
VGGPSDCGDFADDTIGQRSLPHEAAEVRDSETELIALAEIAMVKPVHRYQHHRRALLGAQRDGEQKE